IAGAKVALGASLPRVAMLFAGIDHDFAIVLEQINAQWPGIALIGCTTDGEMSSQILFAEDSLALVLLSGDDFHAVSGVARSVSTDVAGSIRGSVNDAIQRLAGRGGAPRLCITMPDGLTVSGSAALNALRAALGDAVPIFGGNAGITQLTEYPLAVTADDDRGSNSYYLRAPGRTDEAAGCIHFLGDVPDGARVHITTTNRDQILDATRTSFQHALDDFPNASGGGGKPALALCISCAGRKQILGSRTQEEARIVNELLAGVPAVGFYGYGEIARLAKDGISHYHNETFTTLLLGGRVGSA